MLGINFDKPTRVESAHKVEKYISLDDKERFTDPPAYHFPEELELPGLYYFGLNKDIVGKTDKTLYRGFGTLVNAERAYLDPRLDYVASCSIESEKIGRQSIIIGLGAEQVREITDETQLARFVIGQALFSIVQGESGLLSKDLGPSGDDGLIAGLRDEFGQKI